MTEATTEPMTEPMDLVIAGGTVVTGSGMFAGDVAVQGEQIAAVGAPGSFPEAERTIDASGRYVLPGAIDCHAHFNLDGWEIGTRAAARAGITTVIPFASYRAAEEETLPQAIERIRGELDGTAWTDVSLNFILPDTPYIYEELPRAVSMGVSAYKVFMTYKRTPLMSPDSNILHAMEVIAGAGGMLQLHCENGEVLDYLHERAIRDGRTRPVDYPGTCPPWAEAEAIHRAILMGEMTECPIYVVHLSTHEGLRLIRDAQERGQPVWTETCPHYLELDETEMERLGPFAKVGPPLRDREEGHQRALWDGVTSGAISNIGSDHAPADRARKELGRDNVFFAPDGTPIPFGAPSIETLVPVTWSAGVSERRLPPWWFARVLAENPARLFGLYPRKGAIQPGSDADLLVYDPEAEWQITAEDHVSLAGYTPYEGRAVRGRPVMTILRGRVLLDHEELVASEAPGAYLEAGGPIAPLGGAVHPGDA